MPSSVAPLVASWRKQQWKSLGINAPGPYPGGDVFNPGPTGPIGLKVEILLDLNRVAWTDITPYVYYRDGIKITRGRSNEASQVQPQTATLTLNNRDGRFSPWNPSGPYYGAIGRNTPIRISRLVGGSNDPWYRFYGEVPSWSSTSEISGTDVYVQVAASSFLRRINQGNPPALSAFNRVFTQSGETPLGLLAYWSCEDGSGASTLASGIAGGTPMAMSGQTPAKLANYTGFVCSNPLPLLTSSTWIGTIPVDPAGTGPSNVLRFLLGVPSTGAFDTAVIARLYTMGTVARLDVVYESAANGSLRITGYSVNGAQLFTQDAAFAVNNSPCRVSMELTQDGGNVDWTLSTVQPGSAAGFIGGSVAGTIGAGYQAVINPDGHLNDTAVGHISYQDFATSLFDLAMPLNAWLPESPANRFLRLALESLPAFVTGNVVANVYNDERVAMGYQLPDTFSNLLQQAIDADGGGIMYEDRQQIDDSSATTTLNMYERLALYNQAPALALDYSQHQLSAPLEPVADDQLTRNDITVTRINASSARQQLTTGIMSTEAPPTGAGPYPDSISLSLSTDAQCSDQAGWRLHLGTVEEPRYPTISLNLRHPTFTGNPALLKAALALDIGNRLTVSNLPVWLQPDAVSQIVQGYSESLGVFEHDMVLNCSPESPYRIAVLDDAVLSRADSDGSLILTNYGPADAALQVSTVFWPTSPNWTTAPGDFPFDIWVEGERMTVNSITGTGNPQTFNVVRSVNGVVKPQISPARVRLWQPMILSL